MFSAVAIATKRSDVLQRVSVHAFIANVGHVILAAVPIREVIAYMHPTLAANPAPSPEALIAEVFHSRSRQANNS